MKNLKLLYYSLPNFIFDIIKYFFFKLHNPIIYNFINQPHGKNFGVSKKKRIEILKKIIKIINNINSATSLETHITLSKYLLSLPKIKKGYVVECGCYKGASSATISLICKIIGRELIIYDSFEGLPKNADGKRANYLHLSLKEEYRRGMYKGNLESVKKNIEKFGNIEVCIFRKGFFEKTLPNHKEKIEFIFLDVDLPSSTRVCIKYLWKRLHSNSYLFTDDSCDMENVRIWFDNKWWNKLFSINSPGYIGSGCGLALNADHSGLGYTIKNPQQKNFSQINWHK